ILKKFSLINWKRTNKEWNGRAIINGKISKSSTNMLLTLNYIKNKMGLSLTSKENEIENKIR
ncbi:DNA sulfur modification protein DndB, partial [archaeon]|nr:DNA sulfur modification protein DndB [archaeon]